MVTSDTVLFFLIFCLILVGIIVLALMNYFEYQALKNSTLHKVDKMSGLTFEKYLSVIFQERGYKVFVTPDSADFGADLVIEKDQIKTAIQAKRYQHPVGIKAIQEVVAAKYHYKCQNAMVVTNSTFTTAAWKLAISADVWLMDRKRLEKWLAELK